MSLSLPRNLQNAQDIDDFKQQVGEMVNRLEDYLNGQVSVFIIERQRQRRPSYKKGDLVFDLTIKPGFATLQQWDSKKLIPLNFGSISGLVNLVLQGTGGGTNSSLFLRSDGVGGWVLAPIPAGPPSYYEPLSNGILPTPEILFDGLTGDVMMHLVTI